jgi:preprotein translocase SecE subunit
MAKTRAQRKAERRKRAAAEGREQGGAPPAPSRADVGKPPDVGVGEGPIKLDPIHGDDEVLTEAQQEALVERERQVEEEFEEEKREEAEEKAERTAEKAERQPSRAERKEARRKSRKPAPQVKRPESAERHRGPVLPFLSSSWAELKRVQWPDRDTPIQASAVTLIFVAIAAAYLGALDAIFNQLIKAIL